MATGYDNLFDALTDYGRIDELYNAHYDCIGDAQELCEDAADMINHLRAQNRLLESDAAIGRLVRSKLTSRNGVPCERAVIRLEEVTQRPSL